MKIKHPDELASLRLCEALAADPYYAHQVQPILNAYGCMVGPDCLGAMATYEALAGIIPTDRVVWDLGCAEAFQAYFFRRHKRYIGVDLLTGVADRLYTPNSLHLQGSIEELTRKKEGEPDFAICCWVPPWEGDNERITKERFKHCFVIYPWHATDYHAALGR